MQCYDVAKKATPEMTDDKLTLNASIRAVIDSVETIRMPDAFEALEALEPALQACIRSTDRSGGMHGCALRFARLAMLAVFALVACGCAGSRAVIHASPAAKANAPAATAPARAAAPPPSPQEVAVQAALDKAQDAFRRGDAGGAASFVAQARTDAKDDVSLGNDVALTEAALLAYREDFDSAARIVLERIRVAAQRKHGSEYNLHDVMIFVSEARDDKIAALLEAHEMRSVAEHWPAPLHPKVRLGYTWQRAHTLRSYADTLSGPARDAALLYAQRAHEEFVALARSSQLSLPSIAVLDEQFAVLDGDGPRALAAARSLDLEKLDPQDLYITSLALDAGGDHAGAANARERILKNTEFGLFEATYAFLARRAAAKANR